MSISSLFAGMEAYLDGDVEINNNVGAPDDAAENAEIADQTAEVASDTADATEEAKDTEVASQMLSRMCDMYDHVKQFGIDRTFVSLYNRHGELDRVCGIQFPSCESMDVVGDRYSQYSTAFIAAMESSGSGLWAKIKAFIAKIWNWFKTKLANIWNGIRKLFGFQKNAWQRIKDGLKKAGSKISVGLKKGAHFLASGTGALAKWVASHKAVIAAMVAAGTAVVAFVKYAKATRTKIEALTKQLGGNEQAMQKIAAELRSGLSDAKASTLKAAKEYTDKRSAVNDAYASQLAGINAQAISQLKSELVTRTKAVMQTIAQAKDEARRFTIGMTDAANAHADLKAGYALKAAKEYADKGDAVNAQAIERIGDTVAKINEANEKAGTTIVSNLTGAVKELNDQVQSSNAEQNPIFASLDSYFQLVASEAQGLAGKWGQVAGFGARVMNDINSSATLALPKLGTTTKDKAEQQNNLNDYYEAYQRDQEQNGGTQLMFDNYPFL